MRSLNTEDFVSARLQAAEKEVVVITEPTYIYYEEIEIVKTNQSSSEVDLQAFK